MTQLTKQIIVFLFFMTLQQIAKPASLADSVIVYNAGRNGNNTADLLKRFDKDVLKRTPQLVILMVGTNDMLNERNMLSVKEYEKNYQELITKIKKNSDIILMTIPPVNSSYIIMRKPALKFSANGPQERVDSANAVIRKLAAKNKCTLLDLTKILEGCGGSTTEKDGLFQNEANSGIADGVHPTANGYRVIAAAIYQTLITSKPHLKKIVCFGDSITRGYRVQGEGSTEGQTYPAVLKKMLNL